MYACMCVLYIFTDMYVCMCMCQHNLSLDMFVCMYVCMYRPLLLCVCVPEGAGE